MTIRVSKSYVAVAAMAAAFLAPGIAGATVAYDSSLAGPGVYVGTGNANSHFTVSTDNGIELGLSANIRYIAAVTPESGTNIYDVPAGSTTVPGKTGSTWGILFSLNTQPAGGTLTLADISALTIQITDVGTGYVSPTANLLGIPDNAVNGTTGVQNIEPGSFALTFLGDALYDINAGDSYIITLTAYGTGDVPEVLASDQIVVNAVPEPASLMLLGGGLAGLAALRRREKA